MKENPESNPLLEAVLDDILPRPERERLLDSTLATARQCRAARKRRRTMAGASILLLFATMAFWQLKRPVRFAVQDAQSRSVEFVESVPLTSAMIVESRTGNVAVVISSPDSYAAVQSRRDSRSFEEMNDEKLLDLVAGRTVALVRYGIGKAELLFLNPDDEHGFSLR